ncbi:MAG TPA: hypothetical protein ENK87_00815 [Nitratifractor sp.]|nr:hypothetical protein [Nitratifractor sp.]
MVRFLLLFLFTFFILNAQNLSIGKIKKLSMQGEKIVELLCEKSKLPKPVGTLDDLGKKVQESGACGTLSDAKSQAVAFYLLNGKLHSNGAEIKVPEGSKCPVCGMFVYKYPKWAAQMVVDGKPYYFDGVKDMMKFYFFDADFPYDRSKIEKVQVSDFYTLEAVDAREAFYVVGSNVYGPMGNELVPFKSEKEAQNFMQEHKGKKILKFKDITPQIVMGLDGQKI